MIFRTHDELLSIPVRLGKAYMEGYQDTFDGKPEAKMTSYQEQEAYQMGRSRCEAEMRAEASRIG